ncbi:hypothetical protein [Faecalicatena faecalis]|uniref:hypothetical protein n=1 Tax=Faecalicatena faecalis TaxID=2726362 RepID=UPI001C0D0C9D|nr:hypothetical protein [Faecalicatena faecalis]
MANRTKAIRQNKAILIKKIKQIIKPLLMIFGYSILYAEKREKILGEVNCDEYIINDRKMEHLEDSF